MELDAKQFSATRSPDAWTAPLADYQRAVSGQIEAGFTFGQIEDFIDACWIADEQKAALWFWAWLQQPSEVLRTFADSHLLSLVEAESR